MSGDDPATGRPPTEPGVDPSGNEQARRRRQDLTLATLSLILRFSVGAVLIYAALPKLAHPDQFADIVTNYRILPASLVPWLALTLPWLELLVGVFLILGVVTRAAAVLALAMFVVFTGALISAQARHLDIACGCFNVAVDSGKTSESLWASLMLLIAGVALVVLADDGERFSLSRLLRWSASGRRRVLVAVLIALAVVLANALVVAAMSPNEKSPANPAATSAGTVTFLARDELSSHDLLTPLAEAQPGLSVDIVEAVAVNDVVDQLVGGAKADVIEVELDQVPWLVANHYLQPIDTSRLTAWSDLSRPFLTFPGLTVDGQVYAAPVDASITGIVYRQDRVRAAPSSYRDLFAPRFKGKSGIESDATAGIRLGAAALGWGKRADLSVLQLVSIVDLFKKDNPHFSTFYKDQGELQQAFASNGLLISSGTEATAKRVTEAGIPVGYAVPKEGVLVRAQGLAVAADCTNPKAAYALMDYYLSQSTQSLVAQRSGTVPSRNDLPGAASLEAVEGQAGPGGLVLVTPPTDLWEWTRMWQAGHG